MGLWPAPATAVGSRTRPSGTGRGFCSPTCRKRAARGALVPSQRPPAPLGGGGLARAVTEELEEAGRLETVLGQAALMLARRIDADRDTGAGMAALGREPSCHGRRCAGRGPAGIVSPGADGGRVGGAAAAAGQPWVSEPLAACDLFAAVEETTGYAPYVWGDEWPARVVGAAPCSLSGRLRSTGCPRSTGTGTPPVLASSAKPGHGPPELAEPLVTFR